MGRHARVVVENGRCARRMIEAHTPELSERRVPEAGDLLQVGEDAAESQMLAEQSRLPARVDEEAGRDLAVIRGDRKNSSLQGPALQQYRDLYRHVAKVWKNRDDKRFGAVVANREIIERLAGYATATLGCSVIAQRAAQAGLAVKSE